DTDLTYKCEATFYNVLFVLVKQGWLVARPDVRIGFDDKIVDEEGKVALNILASMNPEYEAIITNVPKLMDVDFSALLDERLDYAEQTHIKKERVRLMAACAVHYDLDFGLVLRFVGGEYSAEWRDVPAILAAVDGHVSQEDKDDIERILTKGCPSKLNWEETAANKEIFVRRGNNSSIRENWEAVAKTLNKEERNHHIMPFPRWMCRAS
ncbi:hypothetical protein ACHAXR_000287, partial [Thalassiosira sp. AJA248-18]